MSSTGIPTLLSAAFAMSEESTDGVDLTPLLRGESIASRDLYWHLPLYDLFWASTPAAVIRSGDWKLIEFFGDRFDREGRYHIGPHHELYDLKHDIGESTNLAASRPEKVRQMRKRLRAWIESMGTDIPTNNPHFDPSNAFRKTKEKQPWNQ